MTSHVGIKRSDWICTIMSCGWGRIHAFKFESHYISIECAPPSALMTAVHLLPIEATTLAWKFCGISFHMLTRSPANSCRFDGCWGSRRRRRSISSQTCSMGFKSGEFAGQGSSSISFSFMNCWTTRAVCGRALSCWNVRCGQCWRRNGTTTGSMISSQYITPVRLPSTMITLVRCSGSGSGSGKYCTNACKGYHVQERVHGLGSATNF